MEKQYRIELERIFGGRENFALGFLVARIKAGVEHMCQRRLAVFDVVGLDRAGNVTFVAEVKSHPRRADRPEASQRNTNGDLHKALLQVLDAVERNLTSPTRELWWPLTDINPSEKSGASEEPPLRPTFEDLQGAWRTLKRASNSSAQRNNRDAAQHSE